MNAVIIEDEPLVAKELIKKLQEVSPDLRILTVLPSLKTARTWFRENAEPDLIFMDIQLSDGISFELFQSFELQCPVIFTTAFDEYAVQAFRSNGVDYLMKPVNKDDLKNAVEKCKKLGQKKSNLPENFSELISVLAAGTPAVQYKERFIVNFRNVLLPVRTSEIAYFVRDQLIYCCTFENQRHILDYETLEEIEELLNPARFYRANRQYILNESAIKSIHSNPTGKLSVKLVLQSASEIDVSREKAPTFKKWLDK
ncbi:MAG: response regulator transcription factor [Gemmatimonadaceae bacterium]|nr:response regulator transcription factor [Chitinophagaceae bacterium]